MFHIVCLERCNQIYPEHRIVVRIPSKGLNRHRALKQLAKAREYSFTFLFILNVEMQRDFDELEQLVFAHRHTI